MSNVESKKLGDILNLKRGYDLPSYEREDGLYPIFSSSGISGYHSQYKADGEGVVIGRYGTLGEPYYVNGKYWPHNTSLYVTDFKGNSPKYVYYLLKCLGDIKTSDKSTVPGVNRNELHEMSVPFVTIREQQDKIAAVLSALDAKIEVNSRINAELESLAKTIYDYWFVQFDFPFDFAQGKPSADGKPYKSSGGEMVYMKEGKGDQAIPAGWELKRLSYFCNKIGDGIHGTPEYVDGSSYHFINGNNLKNGFIEISHDTKNVSSDEYQKYFTELNEETILLSINGTLGNLALYTGEKVMLGKSAAYINCKNKYRPYCYQFLKLEHIQKKLWNISTGSTIKNLSLESIKNILVLFPSANLIEQYYELTEPLDNKRKNIFRENQQLTQLRDWLLPMLMNGQVSIK